MIRFRILILLFMMIGTVAMQAKKKYPVIKFDNTTVDLGTFPMSDAQRTCTFTFSNVGNAPLIINYVHTSCGCTEAEFPKDPIAPGARGVITVTYNGSDKMPGRFKKAIQVFSNCKDDLTRVFIQGNMTALKKEQKNK